MSLSRNTRPTKMSPDQWPYQLTLIKTGLLPMGDNGEYTYTGLTFKCLYAFVRGIPMISNAIFAFII